MPMKATPTPISSSPRCSLRAKDVPSSSRDARAVKSTTEPRSIWYTETEVSIRPVLLSTVPHTSKSVGTTHSARARADVGAATGGASGEPAAAACCRRCSRCCNRHQMGHASSWPTKHHSPWYSGCRKYEVLPGRPSALVRFMYLRVSE